MSDLTLAVATINAWNRLCIAARIVPGSYQPTEEQEAKGSGTDMPQTSVMSFENDNVRRTKRPNR